MVLPLKILIAEDNMMVAEDIREYLIDLGYDVIGIAVDATEAREMLKQQPDLLLSDINFEEEEDGVDLARYVRQHYQIPIVFLTAYSDKETVERTSAVQPNGYLVKPFKKVHLFTAIETAIANFQGEDDDDDKTFIDPGETDFIFVRLGDVFHRIEWESIFYIWVEDNHVNLKTDSGNYVIRSSLKKFQESLPNDRFVQVHKSYVANLKHCSKFDYSTVVVAGDNLPLGRAYREALFKYIRG